MNLRSMMQPPAPHPSPTGSEAADLTEQRPVMIPLLASLLWLMSVIVSADNKLVLSGSVASRVSLWLAVSQLDAAASPPLPTWLRVGAQRRSTTSTLSIYRRLWSATHTDTHTHTRCCFCRCCFCRCCCRVNMFSFLTRRVNSSTIWKRCSVSCLSLLISCSHSLSHQGGKMSPSHNFSYLFLMQGLKMKENIQRRRRRRRKCLMDCYSALM